MAQVSDDKDSTVIPIIDDSQFYVFFQGTKDFESSEKAMYEFLYHSYIMPFNDHQAKTTGTILAQFTTEKNGKVYNPEILKGLTQSADSELVRVLRTMPDWYRDTNDSKLIQVPLKKTIRFEVVDSLFQCSESWHANDEELVYEKVTQMPQFPGGEDSLIQFMMQNLRWPSNEADCQGTVYLSFIVQPDGSITNIQVIRSLCPQYDEEALRVVHLFPAWEPGKCQGVAVPVRFNLPVRFVLRD